MMTFLTPSERSVKPETAAGEGTRSPGDRHALVYRLPFGASPVARASALFPTIGPSYCGGWRVGSTPGVPRRVKTLLAQSGHPEMSAYLPAFEAERTSAGAGFAGLGRR